jgi:hypothetical protein
MAVAFKIERPDLMIDRSCFRIPAMDQQPHECREVEYLLFDAFQFHPRPLRLLGYKRKIVTQQSRLRAAFRGSEINSGCGHQEQEQRAFPLIFRL